MSWQELAAKITDIAPMAGATLGGPLGAGIGIAIKSLAGAFGITSPSPQPQEILQAITGDPQALLKLESARLAYEQEKMKDETERIRIGLADIQSAREMGKSGVKDTNLYILAWTMIACFFILVAVLLFRPVPQDQSGVIFMLFGSIATAFGSVISFFFGSSRGSQAKDALLANSTPMGNKK